MGSVEREKDECSIKEQGSRSVFVIGSGKGGLDLHSFGADGIDSYVCICRCRRRGPNVPTSTKKGVSTRWETLHLNEGLPR